MSEIVVNYNSKENASKGACNFVSSRLPDDVQNKLVHYIGRLGPGKDKIIGVGLKGNGPGSPQYLIRIDVDLKGSKNDKGLHFNSKNYKDTSKKYAAVIEPTLKQSDADRARQFNDIVKKISGWDARRIWFEWSTGAGRAGGDDAAV